MNKITKKRYLKCDKEFLFTGYEWQKINASRGKIYAITKRYNKGYISFEVAYTKLQEMGFTLLKEKLNVANLHIKIRRKSK